MAKTTIVRYDNFTKGEFGNVGASAAPQNSFTGINVMRYRNGLLGPRPGLKLLNLTNNATGAIWTMRGLGDSIVFGQGDTVRQFEFSKTNASTAIKGLSKLVGKFTVTIAVPGVLTLTAHGLSNTNEVYLSTTGALPTGLVAGTKYFVVSAAANTFSLSLTSGGAAITTTGSQSGVHTIARDTRTILGSTPSSASTPFQVAQFGKNGYLSIVSDAAYEIDPNNTIVPATSSTLGTVRKYASSVGGKVVGISGERLIVGNTNADSTSTTVDANLIRASTGTEVSFDLWPAGAYAAVSSDDWEITYIDELRNRTVLANTGQEWWTITGDLELSPTIRRTIRADLAPGDWYNASRLGEIIYFVPFGEDFPVEFLGTVTDKFRYQALTFTNRTNEPASSSVKIVAASLGSADCLAFLEATTFATDATQQLGGTPRMLMRWNDTWSYHRFEVPTPSVSGLAAFLSPVSQGSRAFSDNALIMTDGGGVGVSPSFYAFNPVLDRPGFTTDNLAQPGDGSTSALEAEISFPEWWSPSGEEAIVRSISVDFVKWNYNSSGSETCHFDVEVTALHRDNTSGTRTSATVSFDEVTSKTTASNSGTTDRRIFRIGDQGVGHGFILNFSNIRGIAIRRVIVEVNLDPRRQ